MTLKQLIEAVNKAKKEFRRKANVLGVGVGFKVKNGKVTNTRSIIVFVSKKMPEDQLCSVDVIPKTYEGMPVDVVELNPETWIPSKTSVSEKKVEDQLIIAGGVIE